MQETRCDHHTSISIGGRSICNLRFANTKLTANSNGEFQDLTNILVDRATAHGIEVSTENSKIMTNSTNNISADISMNGQKLEEVTIFNPVQRWHLFSRTLHQNCLSDGSNV